MNVFELNNNIKAIRAKVDAGELTEGQVKDTLDSLELPRNEKLDGIANWIESNNARIDWARQKMEQLQHFIKAATNQNESLNKYLTDAIDDMGYKQVKTKNHILKPRNYRASTVIEESALIPKEFIKTIKRDPIERPDKAAIYKALRDGRAVPGAHLKANRKTTIL